MTGSVASSPANSRDVGSFAVPPIDVFVCKLNDEFNDDGLNSGSCLVYYYSML